MPTHDFVDIGDVLNWECLRGTIAAPDSSADTCTVAVDGAAYNAVIFYH